MARGLKVKVAYKDLGLARIVKKLGDINTKSVNVGVVGPKAQEPAGRDGRITNGENAIIQHYGTKHIPARPFLTDAFRLHQGEVVRALSQVVRDVTDSGGQTVKRLKGGARFMKAFRDTVSVDVALDRFGKKMSKLVQDDMLKPGGVGEPNAPSTIRKKGSDHPLIDTGALVESISHRIVRKDFGDALEAGAAVGDYEALVIGVAAENEGEGGE